MRAMAVAGAVLRAAVSTTFLAGAVSGIVWARAGLVATVDPSVGALSAEDLKQLAADHLENATAKGGTGYAFEIVQTSTITARPGGPLIDIPDPANGRVIIGQADEYPYYSLLEHGVVTPSGFWSELRSWPVGAGEPNWDKAELRRSALLRDDASWRNDRDGWYEAKVVPGIGLDPATAALLPRLLRQSSEATKLPDGSLDGTTVLRVAATGEVSDMPGVVSADGEDETRITEPIEFGFDGVGRLVAIHVVALNMNLKGDYDLVVYTVIRIRYDGVSSLPAPEPVFDGGDRKDIVK